MKPNTLYVRWGNHGRIEESTHTRSDLARILRRYRRQGIAVHSLVWIRHTDDMRAYLLGGY